MSSYTVRGAGCVVACGVPVPTDYMTNILACIDMSRNFIYGVSQCCIALFSFFSPGRTQLAFCRSWASFVVFLTILTYSAIIC